MREGIPLEEGEVALLEFEEVLLKFGVLVRDAISKVTFLGIGKYMNEGENETIRMGFATVVIDILHRDSGPANKNLDNLKKEES